MRKKFLKPRQYKNPFLKPVDRQPDFTQKPKIKKWLIIIIIILLLAGLVYFFIYSPVFKIKKIMISGTNNVDINYKLQTISQELFTGYKNWLFPKDNFFIFNPKNLHEIITENIILDDLRVEKKLFNTLKIEATEKLPVLLWNEGGVYYYIDKYGIVMKSILWEDIKYDLPIISRGHPINVIVGRKIIEPDNINFIKSILVKTPEIYANWHLAFLIAPKVDNSEIYFYTNEGWYIIFNTKLNINIQLNNLKNLLEQKIQDRTNLEYIDLRIEDKLFYK